MAGHPPLLAALVVVETTDVVFAVDSIPAIFAVTTEPFLVFTSNAFAILGLRALYFLLAGMIRSFTYLKLGLSAVLVFVGVKLALTDIYPIPIWVSLGVITAVLGVSIVASLRVNPPPGDEELAGDRESAHEIPQELSVPSPTVASTKEK